MSTQLGTVHDGFFKWVMGDPHHAGLFMREHLPREIVELLGREPPEPVPASFVDEELREHHSDLLFRMRLKTGRNALAYVLFEHKSSPDPAARLQLLRYIVRILVTWYEQNGRRFPLPAVLPLLVHQGPGSWSVSCEFADLFGAVPEALRPYLPSFRHALVDLAQTEDRALSGQVRLRAFLKALKYCRHPDLPQLLDILLAEAPELTNEDLAFIFAYVEKGPVAVPYTLVYGALERIVPERRQQIMGWLTEPFYQRGKDEGRSEGHAEGRVEGEAHMFVRLMEKRFGVVPPELRERIRAANVATLEEWAERILEAPDLHAVFESK
jgi:predicted transposase/invertase (TIGR01784 family)